MNSETALDRIIEVRAILRIIADDLDPARVTKLLNVKPDRTFRQGDPRPNPAHAPYRFGLWSRESTAAKSSSPEAHIRELLSLCQARETKLDQLREEGCEIDILAMLTSNDINFSIRLEPQISGSLSSLGIPLIIDNFFMPHED